MKIRSGTRRRRGFTLIEILITLAILGLLVGVVVGNFGNIFGGAQTDAAKNFVNSSLDAPLTAYKIHMGNYPTTGEGLKALMTAPSGKAGKWKGPYINEIPEDPWGNEYRYTFPGSKGTKPYDIYSLGPDGAESGDDIGNWD